MTSTLAPELNQPCKVSSAEYIAAEYIFNRQSINDLTNGYPILQNRKTVESCSKKKMKKLNIFTPKKKVSGPDSPAPVAGHTLDRIINLKAEEKRKWEIEKEEFDRRKKEHEIQLLEIERKEVDRREEGVRKRNDELIEKRRKNRMIQDKMQEQLETLQQKLLEYKAQHKKEEEELENTIEAMEDRLLEVKADMEKRLRDLDLSFEHCDDKRSLCPSEAETMPLATAPRFGDFTDGARSAESMQPPMYPAIPVTTRSYETSKILQVCDPVAPPRNSMSLLQSSVGSSPKSSHSGSERSDTPKHEQSDIDYGSV